MRKRGEFGVKEKIEFLSTTTDQTEKHSKSNFKSIGVVLRQCLGYQNNFMFLGTLFVKIVVKICFT